jgi:hypothetical protein
MIDLLIEFKEQILIMLTELTRVTIVSFSTLGVVYGLGRMLELAHTSKIKNFVALVLLFALNTLYGYLNYTYDTLAYFIWDSFVYGAYSVVFYVVICFRLFDRIDSVLDKIAPDKGEPEDVKLSKRKSRKKK